MNGMGGAPQNKLQAMMRGLAGGGGNGGMQQQQGAGPQQQGPGPDQPTGSPRPNDPAYPGFVKVGQGLKALADMLGQLGDQSSSMQVDQMKIDLMKLGEARLSDFAKKQELQQKLGEGGAQPEQPTTPPDQGNM